MPRNHNCNSDTAANHSMEWISIFHFAQTHEPLQNHFPIGESFRPFRCSFWPSTAFAYDNSSCLNTSFSSQLSFGFTSTALPRHFQKPIARPSVCTVGATRGATLKLFVRIENSNIFFVVRTQTRRTHLLTAASCPALFMAQLPACAVGVIR